MNGVQIEPTLLGAFMLLLLSLYTIRICASDKTDHLSNPKEFLFQGIGPLHSFASIVGSLFSLTYFFGATFVYASLFRGAILVTAALMFIVLGWLLPKIIARAVSASRRSGNRTGHILLDLLVHRFGPKQVQPVLQIYSMIYFALLVEELAVSRLVLSSIFSTHSVVSTLMLATICGIVAVYLKYGGFRAILISDYEQLKVLAPFLLVLALLMTKGGNTGIRLETIQIPEGVNWVGSACAMIFGIAWFAASIDFFARLNFGEDSPSSRARFSRFIPLVLAGLFALLTIGILFGGFLASQAGLAFTSPSEYTEQATRFFLDQGTALTASVFFVAVFCMIFTTVDTLLLSIIQVGHYRHSKRLSREHALTVLAGAVAISTLVPADAVSAVGVFIGSLLIFPFIAVLQAALLKTWRWQPRGTAYLWVGVALSVIGFGLVYSDIKLNFRNHFLLAGLCLVAVLVAFLGGTVVELRSQRRS